MSNEDRLKKLEELAKEQREFLEGGIQDKNWNRIKRENQETESKILSLKKTLFRRVKQVKYNFHGRRTTLLIHKYSRYSRR